MLLKILILLSWLYDAKTCPLEQYLCSADKEILKNIENIKSNFVSAILVYPLTSMSPDCYEL